MEYFVKNGNVYKMKPQYSVSITIIVALFAFAFIGYWVNLPALMWIFLVLGIFSVASMLQKKVIIDTNKQTILFKPALVQPVVEIPFSAIQNFELHASSINFIQTNTSLNVLYVQDGKEKIGLIAQGFTKKSMQRILNELEDIIGTKHG